ncbi:DUF1223 domain-containing protein [Pseudahrensia aquimaris]|uniref:DUF1223 domain-containing protein n=1 Tax=Pseudahrensia aquimaris TaxID=744461 RepID=A0ABW3FID2_9HYPH
MTHTFGTLWATQNLGSLMFNFLARHCFALTLLGGLTALGLSAPSVQAAEQKIAVVELFTSQGCSSCPPADKILAQYAKTEGVLALSWHVDYWNYLGWQDTFSKAEFSQRQRLYAQSFKRRGVYTPQAVVNGRDHAVGSRKEDVDGLIKTHAASGKGLSVTLKVNKTNDTIRFTSSAIASDKKVTLSVIYFDKQQQVKIKRGENRGETITYHNVVRDVFMLGMAEQGVVDVTLPKDALRMKGHDACALILQVFDKDGVPGEILGASVIDGLRGS